MRVTLGSRKNVRINWFQQEGVPFSIKREVEFSYDANQVLYDTLHHITNMKYVFSGLRNSIPSTNIIIFDGNLPQGYLNTQGCIGDTLSTGQVVDGDVTIVDRIVKVIQGEEKIITKPVAPHEKHQFKEIQVHEREDIIKRKITVKNDNDKVIEKLNLQFIEKKDISFQDSSVPPDVKDPPEYTWKVDVPGLGSVSIEITLKQHVKNTYKIEADKSKAPVKSF
ncbi:MAG: hypothetical protein ACTSUE_21700 [Promethearchaeota archaeon]